LQTAGAAIKKVADYAVDLMQAYGKQEAAEIALAQAARNNPLLNGSFVPNIQSFASNFQKLTGINDQVTESFAGFLASSGRTRSRSGTSFPQRPTWLPAPAA
jgi:hypothetical protein